MNRRERDLIEAPDAELWDAPVRLSFEEAAEAIGDAETVERIARRHRRIEREGE